jgi:hypothetical protein
LKRLILSVLFVFVGGSTAKAVDRNAIVSASSRDAEVWGYNLAEGTEEDDIRKNFNLHRGRWWNYYERGSWYLAYGYYEAAEDDFKVVIKKRPTDKRDARTYGMHFRDCFAHRELGITLYHRAIQEETKVDDRLSWLEKSVRYLNKSRTEAPSSRAAFFQDLAERRLWQARPNDDTSRPAITVTNASRTGENWAVVFSNQRTVQLDIRATDYPSGVGAIWINDERLFVECSARTIQRTVHVPVDIDNRWITIRARDLVGNDSPPITVRVELDMRPPVIFSTAHPKQVAPDGSVFVELSAQDDLGLSTIQIDEQKTNCNGQREYEVVGQIKADRDKSRVELRATDLAGNTTEGFVDLSPRGTQARKYVDTVPRFTRSNYIINNELWTTYTWPEASPAFLQDNTFSLAVRTPAHESQIINQFARATRRAAPLTMSMRRLPVFEFHNYRPANGIYLVAGPLYKLKGRLKHAAGVIGIAFGEDEILFKPRHDENTDIDFSLPVRVPDDAEKTIAVKALYARGPTVSHPEPLVFQGISDPTTEPECLYSVIVLPLIPDSIPKNRSPEGLFTSIRDAVLRCKLDVSYSGGPPRFNCRKMEDLDPETIGADQVDLSIRAGSHPDLQVSRLGREYGVDLGICGYIREWDFGEHWSITIRLVDIKTGTLVKEGSDNPIDTYLPKDRNEWHVRLNYLMDDLMRLIPRIRSEVTGTDPGSRRINVDAGEDKGLFDGQKLCVFEREPPHLGSNMCNRLAEATVEEPQSGWSEAVVEETNRGENPLSGLEKDQLFVITK